MNRSKIKGLVQKRYPTAFDFVALKEGILFVSTTGWTFSVLDEKETPGPKIFESRLFGWVTTAGTMSDALYHTREGAVNAFYQSLDTSRRVEALTKIYARDNKEKR